MSPHLVDDPNRSVVGTQAQARHIVTEDETDFRGVDRSRLRPEIRLMLEAGDNKAAVDLQTWPLSEIRKEAETSLPAMWGQKDPLPGIETFAIEGNGGSFSARLYPGGDRDGAMLYFHGGGWVLGSLETHDGVLRALALAAKCKVIAVEYRKAPEAPFPAAIEDAKAALAFIRSSQSALCIDPSQVIVAGDSSGANIAAVLAQASRDDRNPLAGQMLICPLTDAKLERPSRNKFATGFLLTSDAIDWYLDNYCAKMDREDPGISPLYAEDVSGLAPAFIVASDHDPLRDDARAYAMRLVEAGVTVTFEEWRGTVHGFIVMDGITPVARQLCRAMADWANHRWTVADYHPR